MGLKKEDVNPMGMHAAIIGYKLACTTYTCSVVDVGPFMAMSRNRKSCGPICCL